MEEAKYKQMKDSGIEWVGDIPKEWNINKLKYVAHLSTGNSIGDEDKNLYFKKKENEYQYPYISTKDISIENKSVNYDNGMYIDFNTQGFKIAKAGATLLCIEGGNAGKKMTKIDRNVCFVNKLCAIFSSGEVTNNWLYYYIQSDSFNKEFRMHLSGMIGGVSLFELKNFSITVPTIKEQKYITSYLDKETSALDKIIYDSKKVVVTLKKQRNNLISETVTKGLDKKVDWTDSKIDWIGEIPSHWEIRKIRYLGNLQNGISKDGASFGSGYPFVSYSDVYNNLILPDKVSGLIESTKAERKFFSVEKGDVFFTRTSETAEEIGLTSTCYHKIEDATFAGFLIRFRPDSGILAPGFSKYYFSSDILRRFFVKEMMIVTRASLGQNLLKNLDVILPPISEQYEIANYLDEKIGKIDDVIFKLEKIISLAEQTKKSLIYEYITGKKRVRL